MAAGTSPDSAPGEVHAEVAARLATVGQSYTANRSSLVELMVHSDQPLSIPEVLERHPELAQSSVYRNLAVLEEAGVVLRIVTGDEFARFELAEAFTGHHHHHLICSQCGSVEDVTLPPSVEAIVVRELEGQARRRGFEPRGHQVDLIGHCADCR
ncbi:MAG: Fur family transcriptional regulator [Microthrixaceae bacterium]